MAGGHDAKALVLSLLLEHGMLSARLLAEAGVHPQVLARMVEDDSIERVGRGLYGAVDRDDFGASRAAVAVEGLSARKGMIIPPVLCLQTAAVVHRLTTNNKITAVWIAIARGSVVPDVDRVAGLPLRLVVMRPDLLMADVEQVEFGGRDVMVTTRERTIVDMLRMSNVASRSNGLPVVPRGDGLDCLRKGLTDGADPSEIVRIAEAVPRAKWIAGVVAEAVEELVGASPVYRG